jgi:tetratricopeptide (TPR) repeat protein
MDARLIFPVLGACLLTTCAAPDSTPGGALLLDEEITLTRGESVDSARREIAAAPKSVIVVFVDEQLTNVKVELAVAGGKPLPAVVENNLAGAGVEIAAIEMPRASRITVTLTGAQDARVPGHVRLRVRRFNAEPADPKVALQLTALEAWSSATDASHRTDAVKKSALADIDRAIANFEFAQGDPELAGHARLVKANMLYFFQVDFQEARAEAQRAARAFAALPDPAALQIARANFIEASALSEIARIPNSVNPSAEEAKAEARRILAALSSAESPFGPIERARAIDGLGSIDQNLALLDEAQKRYEQAKALYHEAGYAVGELEMLARFAHIYVERGQFAEGVKAFDLVLPEVDRISNPYRRIHALTNAGRANAFAGRADEGVENLLKALAQAREFRLPTLEGYAALELGYLYWYRADYLQGKAFFAQAVRIARAEQSEGLAVTLQSAGMFERFDGNVDAAIELHKEGVRIATNPITRMRTIRQLALDYLALGRYPEAIAELRSGLAIKLQDPRHQAYSDLKRDLAESLIEHGDGSSATHAEAARLLAESLQMCLDVRDKLGEIGAHRVNARLLHRQGKFTAARKEYERAIDLIFAYRRSSANPQLRTQTLGHEQPAFRGYFDLMMRDVTARGPGVLRLASAMEEDALRKLELARESHFGMPRPARVDATTTARIDALLAQLADKSLEIAAMLKGRDMSATTQLDEAQLEMARLRAELDRVRTAAAAAPNGDDPSSGHIASSWRVIAPGTAQLSYALGNEHVYVWERSAGGTRVAMLSQDPESMERELTELASLDPQHSPEKVEQLLAHISAVLLPAGLLHPDTTALEIVAEGRIASVPFAGLRSPTNHARRLVETHAITMITSMFAVGEPPPPKRARPFRLVALASGAGTLRSAPVADPAPRLHAATAEIRAVADLFEARDKSAKVKLLTGREGSAATLRGAWSAGADVVHFATHALADLRQPLASLLVLPAKDDSGQSTYLTAGQVQDWRGDVDLVFLSACDSAIGPPRFAGGMPGLQSAFLRAGARGVIATLWPIEDVLAREFSANFYQRFTRGESAVQALSATQRAWLAPDPSIGEAEQARRRITALAHGFYTQ